MFDSIWQWIWPLAGILAVSLYFYLKQKYSYWSSQGINGPVPLWGIGNVHQKLFKDLQVIENEWIQKYGRVYGAYLGPIPFLTIAEPELIKQVLIKDFQYFVNRMQIKAYHELWNKNLFSSNDDDWKRVRTITSPSFSSGKLHAMNSIMRKCVDKLDEHLDKLCSSGKNVIETKKTLAGFTIDVMASTAFATEIHANDDENNPFVVNGLKVFDVNPFRALATLFLPTSVLKMIGIESIFDPKVFNFFIDLTRYIVEQRKSGKTGHRNDLVQLLLDASVDEDELRNVDYDKMIVEDGKIAKTEHEEETKTTQKKAKLTDTEIIANCIFVLVAGFDTTATTLANCMFELAVNQDIQNRLYEELNVLDELDENSEEYFDSIMHNSPYLEAVIKETLRRYSPVTQMNRVCSKEGYKVGGATLYKGQLIVIPIMGIHLNPDYYPEPKRFNPDRFMPENKHLLVPYTFLPFSLGPRNCIGMRFAYQEIKLCLAKIVRKYRLNTTPDTPEVLTFKEGRGLLIVQPFPIEVNRRTNDNS